MVDVTPRDEKLVPDQYLGDGVYASYDGFQLWLDTRAQTPVNRIALEPSTFNALLAYVERIKAIVGARIIEAAIDPNKSS